MKTLSCSGNESVSWHKGTLCNTVNDDTALQFSWYFEIRKQHSNVVMLLRVYTPNPFDCILTFEIWQTRLNTMLTHTNGQKRQGGRKKHEHGLACVRRIKQTPNSDWYQLAQHITYFENRFILRFCRNWAKYYLKGWLFESYPRLKINGV